MSLQGRGDTAGNRHRCTTTPTPLPPPPRRHPSRPPKTTRPPQGRRQHGILPKAARSEPTTPASSWDSVGRWAKSATAWPPASKVTTSAAGWTRWRRCRSGTLRARSGTLPSGSCLPDAGGWPPMMTAMVRRQGTMVWRWHDAGSGAPRQIRPPLRFQPPRRGRPTPWASGGGEAAWRRRHGCGGCGTNVEAVGQR